jgi:hypothetical protein
VLAPAAREVFLLAVIRLFVIVSLEGRPCGARPRRSFDD